MNRKLRRQATRVQEALQRLGQKLTVVELAASTRTAQDAADAIGCPRGMIVKSLVFKTRKTARPVLVLASGDSRVDVRRLRTLVGEKIGRANAAFVREHTGFAIGGVAPVGHSAPLKTFVDRKLLQFTTVWAAAGTPYAVFSCSPEFLATLGTVTDVREDSSTSGG